MSSTEAPGKRRSKYLKPVNPVLDHGLTAAYLVVTAWTFKLLSADFESIQLLLAFLPLSAFGIWATKRVYRVLGRFISSKLLAGPPFNNPLGKKRSMGKWCDQSWQLVVHASMAAIEYNLLSEQDWFWDTRTCWIPEPRSAHPSYKLKAFYLLQLSIWIYTGFSHRFLEPKKRDYVVMFVHHIATIVLVAFSHASNTQRIGLLVLFVHDVSDIFLDLLKMVNFLKLEGVRGFFLSEILYVLTIVSWASFRLWQYPFRVMNSSVLESHAMLSDAADHERGRPWASWSAFTNISRVPYWHLNNFFLSVLLLLHVWWFGLLLRIGYRMLTSKNTHQVGREEYEGSSGDELEEDDHKTE